ncbi:MAG: DMT family transporter [Rhodobacteraceae bacterium]|nr:DMT family transporter [Paracoccaceae bacterium]
MRPPLAGHAAMLAFSGLVAGSFALGAIVAPMVSPVALAALRFALAAAVIAAVALVATGIPASAFRAPWRYALLGGVFAIYFVLMFQGLKTADPVSTAAVFTLTPLMSAGFGRLLLGQRMTGRVAAALAIGAAGALWVIFRADPAALLRFQVGRGEAVFFLGCVAHALYTPLVRRLNRGESALVFPVGTFVGGAVVLAALGWRDVLATDWPALPPVFWAVLAYLAVVASALTLVLLQFAALRLPAARVMAYTYLVPAWVILWQVALGNQPPAPRVAIGVALTAVALLMLLREDAA